MHVISLPGGTQYTVHLLWPMLNDHIFGHIVFISASARISGFDFGFLYLASTTEPW